MKYIRLNTSTGEILDSQGRVLGRLNSSEALIVEYLSKASPSIIDKNVLLDFAWPKKIVSPNSLNVAVKNIREVFESKCMIDDIIQTHVKKGFSWCENYRMEFFTEEESSFQGQFVTDDKPIFTPEHAVIQPDKNKINILRVVVLSELLLFCLLFLLIMHSTFTAIPNCSEGGRDLFR